MCSPECRSIAFLSSIRNTDPAMPCVNGDTTARVNTARSRHSGGVNTVYGDGSVRFVPNSINLLAWQAMGSMSNGEVVSE